MSASPRPQQATGRSATLNIRQLAAKSGRTASPSKADALRTVFYSCVQVLVVPPGQ
jgi:hypothetical protein